MLFSRDWLSQYVDLPDSAIEIGAQATSIGFAVESLEKVADDIVFDLEINPNRPDCMNHLGLARELAVATGRTLRRPAIQKKPGVQSEATSDVKVEIEDVAGCPRYAAAVVRGVEVGSSPEWLVRRLEAVGVRSINNIVDLTNFVLWEYGQPLHAFDLDRLASPRIIVRRALAGELLVTLDGEKRELDPDVLVIADEREAVALAGIMGGSTTEVTEQTTNVLIESAHFAPAVVRRGAKLLGMHTDASHRFERGSDSEICLEAAWRAATLMAEMAGGELPESVVDCRKESAWQAFGLLDLDKLDEFAGTSIPQEMIERIFPALGFGLEATGKRTFTVKVPSWRRFDLELAPQGEVYSAHFYEEALRFFGYEEVPATLPAVSGPDAGSSTGHERRESLRRFLSSTGLAETITYGFYGSEADDRFPGLARTGSALKLANALSEQYSLMRRSLLPNLVEGARFNQNRGLEAVRLFEVGHVFPGGMTNEIETIGIVIGGSTGTPWSRSVELDFFDLKGIVEGLAQMAGVRLEFRSTNVAGFVPGTACEVKAVDAESSCGYMGRVADSQLAFGLYAAELDAAVLSSSVTLEVEPPSRFPGVSVDLTLTHPTNVEWSAIAQAIERERPGDLRQFGLKDRYLGRGVPQGAVNTTIYFFYNSTSGSLTREEVNERHERVAQSLRKQFGKED
jgi:phenylalanyl-tRNA synthetase beta chain